MNTKIACITMAICLAGAATVMQSKDTDVEKVENLLKRRTAIMENTLSGKITYKEAKRLLSEIEKGKLLTEDIKSLTIFADKQYDNVSDMKIISMEKTNHISDVMLFEGEIQWLYERNDLIYSQNNVYNIGVNEMGTEVKLVSLELKK